MSSPNLSYDQTPESATSRIAKKFKTQEMRIGMHVSMPWPSIDKRGQGRRHVRRVKTRARRSLSQVFVVSANTSFWTQCESHPELMSS